MINASELAKQRELVFAAEPRDQVEKAYALLNGLPNCKVQHSDKPHTLLVNYSLLDYTLEGLERALTGEGFILDNNLLHRIARQMIYYTEDTECHNMDIPDHPTKKQEKEVYIKAYDQHLHGDHDDTPPESRKYK